MFINLIGKNNSVIFNTDKVELVEHGDPRVPEVVYITTDKVFIEVETPFVKNLVSTIVTSTGNSYIRCDNVSADWNANWLKGNK